MMFPGTPTRSTRSGWSGSYSKRFRRASKDGKTIYIDSHMPSSLRYYGRNINTDRHLILHEAVEKTLIDQLNLHICTPIRSSSPKASRPIDLR